MGYRELGLWDFGGREFSRTQTSSHENTHITQSSFQAHTIELKDAMTSNPLPNDTPSTSAAKPIQVSFPLSNSVQTKVHLHITSQSSSLLIFATTADSSSPSSTLATLGSFVYALPNLHNTSESPISTALYSQPHTIDFTTRLAKLLAKKTSKPCYVGWSGGFAEMARGGDVEEEMGALKNIGEVVVRLVDGSVKIEDVGNTIEDGHGT